MKKIIAILILSAAFAAGAFAQNMKDIYNSYKGKEGISTVYISPMMFRMLGTLPDLKVEDQDIKLIAESLTEFYVINCEQPSISSKLVADSESIINRSKLELLMEASDDSEQVRLYVREDKDFYTDFLMIAVDASESNIISFTGKLRKESLSALLGKNL